MSELLLPESLVLAYPGLELNRKNHLIFISFTLNLELGRQ